MREYRYVKIPELARILGISREKARQIAKCKRMQMRKGAVLDVGQGTGKYRVLTVSLPDAIETFQFLQEYIWTRKRA